MTTPSISAQDLAIAEVQLGLSEIALGLELPGDGLPDRRGFGDDALHDPVDIPLLVPADEIGEYLFGSEGRGGQGKADLCDALDQLGECLADAREALVEVDGNVGKVAFLGVRGKPERNARLQDLFMGLIAQRIGDLRGLTPLVEFFP